MGGNLKSTRDCHHTGFLYTSACTYITHCFRVNWMHCKEKGSLHSSSHTEAKLQAEEEEQDRHESVESDVDQVEPRRPHAVQDAVEPEAECGERAEGLVRLRVRERKAPEVVGENVR